VELISLMCERARRWSSLRVDGELSELESALLDAHLGRCPACAEFARGAEAVSEALAAAGLEEARIELVLPRSRRFTALARTGAVAATIACIGAGLAAFGHTGTGSATALKPVAMVAAGDSTNELRSLRREALILHNRVIPRNRQVPGESV
jgi:anti-sigma factor RsiW